MNLFREIITINRELYMKTVASPECDIYPVDGFKSSFEGVYNYAQLLAFEELLSKFGGSFENVAKYISQVHGRCDVLDLMGGAYFLDLDLLSEELTSITGLRLANIDNFIQNNLMLSDKEKSIIDDPRRKVIEANALSRVAVNKLKRRLNEVQSSGFNLVVFRPFKGWSAFFPDSLEKDKYI